PHGNEHGARRTQGAGHRHQEPRLRRQDLSQFLLRPGETPFVRKPMPRHLAKPQAALVFLAFVLWPSSFAQALDPESTTPYKVQVLLRVAPHRLLTPIFKDQVKRD